MDQTSTPITTRLTIVTEGRAISDDTQEAITTPNTGIINSTNAPMIFGGALLLIAVLFVFFKNRRKTGFHLSKKHTVTISVIAALTLFGLLNAAPKLNQPEEAKAAKVQRIEADYLTIDAASDGELTLNLDDFESGKIAYIKDTITVNEDIVGAHTVEFTATVPEDIPFSEALVYTTGDPTAQDTTWQALPADKTIVVDTDASAEGQTYDIYYGVNPTEIPAGTYTIDINYDANITFDGTMQSMNQTICRRLPLETRFTLKDVRDDKEYRIVHLADDSCWMVDNLALELSTSKALTSADTDLNTKDSWTPNKNTIVVAGDWSEYWNGSCGAPDSIESAICMAEQNSSVYDKTYDTYYYNWSAATATDLNYEAMLDRLLEEELYVAKDSICPKGWQLPLDAHYSSAFNAYGSDLTVWDMLRIRSGNGLEFYPITSTIGYDPLFRLEEYTFWSEDEYWEIYGDQAYYASDVRCVLNYSGEATLAIGSNIQTATMSRAGAEFTIPEETPIREGYIFWGYTAIETDQNTNASSEIVYLPGKTYTFYAPHTVLYPTWSEGYLEMQYVDEWGYDLPMELQVQAIDTRDDKLYWVAKLKDGNVWMTQNLDYDITYDNIVSYRDGSTTTWSPSFVTSTNLYDNVNVASGYSLSYDPGSYYSAKGTSTTKTPIDCTVYANDGQNCHYHLGNYYQFNAATAGSGMGLSSDNSASMSICPSGWVLPVATEKYDAFAELFSAYGSIDNMPGTTILARPLYFTLTGQVDYAYNSNDFNNFGSSGHYWTATKAWSVTHWLSFSKTSVSAPSHQGLYEGYGNSVRCVAMQEIEKPKPLKP